MPVYDNVNGVAVPRGMSLPVTAASRNNDRHEEKFRPLVNQWLQKAEMAERAKSAFQTVADQCYMFYSKSSGFMWRDDYLKKHVGSGIQRPKFEITLQKAFELVAIFGPYLFWKYPNIWIKSEEPIEMTPEDFGDPNDPFIQQMFSQVQAETSQEMRQRDMRNALMQKYLNYTQREQYGGGLAIHLEMAITEALVKGRGCIWVEDVKFPGSDRTLTGRFYESVDCLLIDPDSRCPQLTDAQYIMRFHLTHSWQLEKLFDLPKNTLRGKGSGESLNSHSVNNGLAARLKRRNGEMNDMIPWFEIWSRAGVGSRMAYDGDAADYSMSPELHDALDNTVGDHAYLCVSPSVPWPLNFPSQFLESTSDEEVKERFQWRTANYGAPFPTYLDRRWPVALLDFYRDPDSPWPIAPLAPALGELTCMNIMISAYVEKCYENRKSLIAALGSARKSIDKALASRNNPAVIEINDAAGQTIEKMLAFIERPDMNNDLLEGIMFLERNFEKRTGLNEFMYAGDTSGAKSRTKADVDAKDEKSRIRPEKMAVDVARFMTESADLEKFLAGWIVEGSDVIQLLGRYGAMFWDQLIVAEDPEVIVREMRATVEASDIRKPNKERMAANLQTMLQTLTPMLQQYAQDTGDTDAINVLLEGMEESMESDFGIRLGQWRPQSDPQAQQLQQAMAQLEQAKLQAELQKLQVETQGQQVDNQGKQIDSQVKQIDAQKSMTELQKMQLETQLEAKTGGADILKQQLELQYDQADHVQEMRQDAEKHAQEMMQKRNMALIDLVQKREETRVKLEGMQIQNRLKAQAARKTQENGSAA